MAYEDRRSDSGCATAAVLAVVVLLGGFVALGVGTWFFLRVSTVERQVVMERNNAMAAQEEAERFRIEAEILPREPASTPAALG